MDLLTAWAEAGQSPDAFWHQTPASFGAVMDGVRRRLEREQEAQVSHAWTTAALTRVKDLKPLKHYLRRQVKQSPSEMLAVMREFQARGANMTFTKIER